MKHTFRKAEPAELPVIWTIVQQAIARRKQEGSRQWQDGYPSEEVIRRDIEKGAGYVLVNEENTIGAYSAILVNDEPAYAELKGNWLSEGDFLVLHRIAVSDALLGRGLAQKILLRAEELALRQGIFSIKIDTNFDNAPMLAILQKLGYTYCGEVFFRGAERKAFEKLL